MFRPPICVLTYQPKNAIKKQRPLIEHTAGSIRCAKALTNAFPENSMGSWKSPVTVVLIGADPGVSCHAGLG